jgi:chemotaxis protein MotB
VSEKDQDIEDEEIGPDEEDVSAVDDTVVPDPDQVDPEPEPEPEPELVECPPCKKGSPAWMATFADMATLLMAFFVLILSFAHVNVPKYKEVSGSMRSRFGVQVLVPIVEAPSADNMVATQYRQMVTDPTAANVLEEQRSREG